MIPVQDTYIQELQFIADELSATFFSLQCLYAYRSGQMPALTSCPEHFADSCWRHTRDSLDQNLDDLAQIIDFLEHIPDGQSTSES